MFDQESKSLWPTEDREGAWNLQYNLSGSIIVQMHHLTTSILKSNVFETVYTLWVPAKQNGGVKKRKKNKRNVASLVIIFSTWLSWN